MRKYSHKEALKLSKQKAKLKKQLQKHQERIAKSKKISLNSDGESPLTTPNKEIVKPTSKPLNTHKKSPKHLAPSPLKKPVKSPMHRKARAFNLSPLIIIVSGVIILGLIGFLGFKFILPIIKDRPGNDVTASVKVAEKSDVPANTAIIETAVGMKTDFVRNQMNTNMLINTAGNIITIENTEDYHFMDLVFRETNFDGDLINKKIIKSEYTTYSYVSNHCNDIIEVDDGYILVGYQKRGDYSDGRSDIDAWIAKFDSNAALQWEKIFDDGYKKGEILSIEKTDSNFRLFVKYEALENTFMIVDENANIIETEKSEEIIAYSDAADGGKIFLKKRNSEISIVAKNNADGSFAFEKNINGKFSHIFSVAEGFIIFGEKEIDLKPTVIVSLFDHDANIVWDKQLSSIGSPTINSIKHFENSGYFLTGYMYHSEDSAGPRQVKSAYDASVQDIQDAWVLKLDDAYDVSYEKTYAYGDMGSSFHDIKKVGAHQYYLLGNSQNQGENAATIINNTIITGITDQVEMPDEGFIDLESASMTDTPIVNDVAISVINRNVTNGTLKNDYAIKVYWSSVSGASEYEVTIYDKTKKLFSQKTTDIDHIVLTDLRSSHEMYNSYKYKATVTAIGSDGEEIASDPFNFSLISDDYALLRNWYLKFTPSNRNTDIYFKTSADYRIDSVKLSRVLIEDSGEYTSRELSVSSEKQMVDEFTQLTYGRYFYRMEIKDNMGVMHTMDTQPFTYNKSTDIPYTDIDVDEARLKDEVGLTDNEIQELKDIIYVGQFQDDRKSHVIVLQKFINYYLGELAKLGIYSPDTEPESGFDIPIELNAFFGDDTRKATAYLLSYFGRYGVDGERITHFIDGDFISDVASLTKRPLSNDIIAAFRYDGKDAKYNAGYSFDTNYNKLKGVQFAMPIDHQPLKSAYFGIRYLPSLNGEAYDTGVRLHAGLDFRAESLMQDDFSDQERDQGDEYIDTADKIEEVEVEKKSPREIRRDRIYSLYDGVVVKTAESEGNGLHVLVKHVTKDANKHTFYTQYLHLSSILADVGQPLKRGEVLGTMGDTGYSGGKHLHLEIFTPAIKSSVFFNPLIYEFSYPPLLSEAKEMEIALAADNE